MKSILVIEDNENIRENTAEILELAGYKAFTAENGKRGVEIALKENPSLVVCDIMMPELDGYGVLHLLKNNKATESLPFIFLTAKTERGDMRKGMEMGADDYITKPFDDIELLRAIEIRLKKAEIVQNSYPSNSEGVTNFLEDIKKNCISDLNDNYEIESYPKKHMLYSEGKRPRYLYYVINGKVKTYTTDDNGKEYITDLYSTGDFIGYNALIREINYDDAATVLEDAELLQIPREDFMKMIYCDMNIAAAFIRIMSKNLKEKEDRMLQLAYGSLRKRVAKALVEIHDKFSQENKEESINISREDIAHYVGTTTESLIRTVSDFKSEKLIEIKDTNIIIRNLDKLKDLLY
ncbi:MAG: response regulator [Bacteroidota bacterium]|nr:response regulator [Bacteroidota bacterium]